MASLNTVFKNVYSEALEPYGFKKIKGRQPYFVRMVGDEIIHVITYTNYPSLKDGYKEFSVFGGVATVYRPRINLDETPRNNTNWFDSNIGFYRKSDFYDEQKDMFHEWYTFSYETGNEESMIESVKKSFCVTEQVMLPILSKVVCLKSCRDYFRQFASTLLNIYDDEQEFGKGACEYNEGLMNFLVVNLEEYTANVKIDFEKINAHTLALMERGKIGLTRDEFEARKKLLENSMKQQISKYERCMKNDRVHTCVMEELEHRKCVNLNILKSYGLTYED